MDAVEYVKALRRLCISQSGCKACQLIGKSGCIASNMNKEAEKGVPIVEQWAKDHPVKTRQSEFLKMFPHANINSFTDTFCVAHFDKTKTCKVSAPTDEMCEKCRDAYWNEEVSE